MNVYLLATLDTKGQEAAWLRDRLGELGVQVQVIDCGSGSGPLFAPDVSRDEVFAAAGSSTAVVTAAGDRGAAVTLAAAGAAQLMAQLHAAKKVAGVIGIGGSAGTTIGTAAMRALPLGIPKLMVSTLASGQVRHYVGDKDILMLNSVVDLAGVNRITRLVLGNAARAMAGMVLTTNLATGTPTSEKPLVAATMFGVTTPCVEQARAILETSGYEVLVFHATGAGGQAMESLIADGFIAGVLDITTTELADEVVGGFLSAGPTRLTAAGRAGIPQVVSVGATDMVNFHAPETVPERFRQRKFHQHNSSVTLMRTTVEENRAIGSDMGHKLAAALGPVALVLPARGVSAIDRSEASFDDPAARQALFASLRETISAEARAGHVVEIVELDCHINDPEFAAAAARKLIRNALAVGSRPSIRPTDG